MPQQSTICVVDDDSAIRSLTVRMLESAGWSVTEFSSGEDFLDASSCEGVECLVLDVRMHVVSGLSVQEELIARDAGVPIVFVSGFAEVSEAVEAMRKGAIDFLQKPFSARRLLAAVEAAVAHGRSCRREAVAAREAARLLAEISPRQVQVLDLLMKGRLNKQIASELGIAERTVEIHRSALMRKMKASCLVDLVKQYHLASHRG